MRDRTLAVLHGLSSEYIRSRRASGELRTRLVSVVHERSRLTDGIPDESRSERTQRQLEEIEHIRATLERSARAADERLRALESVIGAVAGAAVEIGPEPGSVQPAPAATLSPEPEPWVRGGFTEPGSG